MSRVGRLKIATASSGFKTRKPMQFKSSGHFKMRADVRNQLDTAVRKWLIYFGAI